MKRLTSLVLILTLIVAAGVGASFDGAAEDREVAQGFEICFPDVPGIEHCVHPVFSAYYQRPLGPEKPFTLSDSIRYLGYPLTAGQYELNADGHCVFTQWFERGAVEYHPGNDYPYDRLLRRLGAEVLGRTTEEPGLCDPVSSSPTPEPTSTPTPTPTSTPRPSPTATPTPLPSATRWQPPTGERTSVPAHRARGRC